MKRADVLTPPGKRRPLLRQMLQEEIKAHIIRHRLRPGDPLPSEAELAQQLEVSRNSIREAVKALEGLGVVEVRHGAGLFVQDFSFDPIIENLPYAVLTELKQVSDILEIRFLLEYGMAERVVESLTTEQLDGLRATLRRMEERAERGEYLPADDRAFHEGLYQNIGNPILVTILDVFWELFRQARDRSELSEVRDPRETYERHVEIFRALEQRDIRAVREAIAGHNIGLVKRLYSAGDVSAARIYRLAAQRLHTDADLPDLLLDGRGENARVSDV